MHNNMKEQQVIVGELRQLLGDGKVITDAEVLKMETVDYVGYRRYERFNGQYLAHRSFCVVKPHSTQELSAVLQYLDENRVPCIPKTGGSSATAAIESAAKPTVVVDGSAMNKLLALSEQDMMVTVQCGMPMEYLENYLNERGYTTGHQPQSLPMAQVGGLVATRSIGQFSTLYGGVEDMVVGLEAVLPNGEVVRIKNVPRRAAGPDLRHLFIGNEGALAYITEVTLKLYYYRPEDRWMQAYSAKGMSKGLAFIREIMVRGYKPAVVRLHDENEAELKYGQFVEDGEVIVLLIADGPKPLADATGQAIGQIAQQMELKPLGAKPLEVWLVNRNDVCDEMEDTPVFHKGLVTDTCEISASWSTIGEIFQNIMRRIPEEIEEIVFLGGHASHCYMQGTNIYFVFDYKASNDFDQTRATFYRLLGIIMEETLALGGSISHHHGIGKYRTQWVKEEHGSSYTVLETLKNTLDPNGIMNKGTLYPCQE